MEFLACRLIGFDEWWLLTCRGVGRSDTRRWKWHNYNGSSMAIHVQFVKVESRNLELTHVFQYFCSMFPPLSFSFFRLFSNLNPHLPNGFFNSAALDTQMTEACCQLMVCRATVDSTLNSCRSCRNCPGRRCLSSRPSGRWGETGYTNDRINVAIKSH